MRGEGYFALINSIRRDLFYGSRTRTITDIQMRDRYGNVRVLREDLKEHEGRIYSPFRTYSDGMIYGK